MVTCLRMPEEKRSDELRWPLGGFLGDWVLQSGPRGQCLTSFVILTSFPVAGKAASLSPALFWSLCTSDTYTLIDSGSVHYCFVLSTDTHKPSSMFWVLLFVLRKGLFSVGLADLDSAWIRLASNLEQSATSASPVLDYRCAPPHLASSLFWEHFRFSFKLNVWGVLVRS